MSVRKTESRIPANFKPDDLGQAVVAHELQTNILTYASASSYVNCFLGAKIANSRGVPGTLGCIAHTRDNRRTVLLTNWHVLFGNGGCEGGAVWLVDETCGSRQYRQVGRTLFGKFGKVCLDGTDYHVDCAVSSFLSPLEALHHWPIISEYDAVQPEDLVTKTGAATGITIGIVVDIKHSDYAWFAGRSYPTLGQLLVRPLDKTVFSAEGDSGSLLMNMKGKAVGLLWGTNSCGEGVACPIAPILYALNLTLE